MNRQEELLVNEDLGQNVIFLAALASDKVAVSDYSGLDTMSLDFQLGAFVEDLGLMGYLTK